jgi:hypothetical protein
LKAISFYVRLRRRYGGYGVDCYLCGGAEEFRALSRTGARRAGVVTQYGKPSVVIISAAEYERSKELDRRVMRLDEMSDAEIEEMLNSNIPPEHRYSLSDIDE